MSVGNRTIARFSTETGSLTTEHHNQLKYVGDVDLRFNDMGRLGEVDVIKLIIDFSYGDELAEGELTTGHMFIVKRDGETIVRKATCERYLKSE